MLDLLTIIRILATLGSKGGMPHGDDEKYPAGTASDAQITESSGGFPLFRNRTSA
jgi:hypothetical protein